MQQKAHVLPQRPRLLRLKILRKVSSHCCFQKTLPGSFEVEDQVETEFPLRPPHSLPAMPSWERTRLRHCKQNSGSWYAGVWAEDHSIHLYHLQELEQPMKDVLSHPHKNSCRYTHHLLCFLVTVHLSRLSCSVPERLDFRLFGGGFAIGSCPVMPVLGTYARRVVLAGPRRAARRRTYAGPS